MLVLRVNEIKKGITWQLLSNIYLCLFHHQSSLMDYWAQPQVSKRKNYPTAGGRGGLLWKWVLLATYLHLERVKYLQISGVIVRNYDSCSDVIALWRVRIRNSCMNFQSHIVISSRVDIQSSKMVSYGDVMFGPFGSVWCKMILGEVGVSLPWWCHALVLLAPGYWRLYLNLIIFS